MKTKKLTPKARLEKELLDLYYPSRIATNILILPLPTSNNNRLGSRVVGNYPHQHSIKYPTEEYNVWKKEAQICYNFWLKQQDKLEMLIPSKNNHIQINYVLYKRNDMQDNQNYEKALADFLTDRIIENDIYFKLDLIMPSWIDKVAPRVEVDVYNFKVFHRTEKKIIKVKKI
jgi:hypothetical protein